MTRNQGITTQQMQQAPQGALYVWPNHHLSYPNSLARELKRTDLKIISPSNLENQLIGARRKEVVIDHACELSSRMHRFIAECEVAGCKVYAWHTC